MAGNFNIEIFNKYGYEQNCRGDYKCPSCEFFVALPPDQDMMTNQQKQEFWQHVADEHQDVFNVLVNKYSQQPYQSNQEKADRLFIELGQSSGKMNQLVNQFGIKAIDAKELYQLICQEQQHLQEQIHKILTGSSFSSSPQQQQQQPASTLL